jgi:proteasome lid subunit RPN8/RPN11
VDHVVDADVVHAEPLAQSADRIDFTCAGETADQLVAGENPRLIGTVHSHPSKNQSRLSRVDTMTWGRTSPVVKVMGIYTEEDDVQFFTVRSMQSPLPKDVR